MKKVSIKKNQIETHSGIFEDPTSWIAQEVANNSWGLPERPELDEMGQPTGVILPAEYTIEITDITAEIEQEKANTEALKYLADTDWLMIRELEIGKPMPEEIKLKRQEARNKVVK